MISSLVFRHNLLRSGSALYLNGFLALAALLNVMGVLLYRSNDGPWNLGAGGCIALGLALMWGYVGFLLKGKDFRRCRAWEQGLPLSSRDQWLSYYLVLLLVSVLLCSVLYGVLGGLMMAAGRMANMEMITWGSLGMVFFRPWALMAMMAAGVAAWRPSLANPGDHPQWGRFRSYLVIGAFLVLGISVYLPWWVLMICVAASVGLVMRVWGKTPTLLELAESHYEDPVGNISGAVAGTQYYSRSDRWVTHRFLVMSLTKTPASFILLLLFTMFFGVFTAGYYPMDPGEPNLRFLNFVLVVYVLFAMSVHYILKLGKVDSLPISRRFILSWLVVPLVLSLSLGYGLGRGLIATTLPTVNPMAYDSPDCEDCSTKGLSVDPEYFSFSFSREIPLIEAPWGETCTPRSEQVMGGLPWQIWKPFTTSEQSSPEFVAWQISRAARKIYGIDLDQNEIRSTYLEARENGQVYLLKELDLVRDYPGTRALHGGPVFPIITGLQVFLFLLVQGLVFRWCIGHTSRKSVQVRFWSVMVLLVGIHISGLAMLYGSLSEDWIITGVILGQIRLLGQWGLSGHIVVWVGMLMMVAGAWRFALSGFSALDALPQEAD
jgi:hypothetical protein